MGDPLAKSKGSGGQIPASPSQVRSYLLSALSASLPHTRENGKADRKTPDLIGDRKHRQPTLSAQSRSNVASLESAAACGGSPDARHC